MRVPDLQLHAHSRILRTPPGLADHRLARIDPDARPALANNPREGDHFVAAPAAGIEHALAGLDGHELDALELPDLNQIERAHLAEVFDVTSGIGGLVDLPPAWMPDHFWTPPFVIGSGSSTRRRSASFMTFSSSATSTSGRRSARARLTSAAALA